MPAKDLKKVYKDLYTAKVDEVSVINVPENMFLTITGEGHPDSQNFQSAIEALYNVAYTIKMMPRQGIVPKQYYEYVVPSLECIYWLVDNSNKYGWKLMIMQPEFVNESVKTAAFDLIIKKGKNLPRLLDVKLEKIKEGIAVQSLHVGPYETVGSTHKKIQAFMTDNNYKLNGLWHEIYLSDKRKTQPEKLKTIIRGPVVKI